MTVTLAIDDLSIQYTLVDANMWQLSQLSAYKLRSLVAEATCSTVINITRPLLIPTLCWKFDVISKCFFKKNLNYIIFNLKQLNFFAFICSSVEFWTGNTEEKKQEQKISSLHFPHLIYFIFCNFPIFFLTVENKIISKMVKHWMMMMMMRLTDINYNEYTHDERNFFSLYFRKLLVKIFIFIIFFVSLIQHEYFFNNNNFF